MRPCHSYSEPSLIFANVAVAKWRYREPSDCFGTVGAALNAASGMAAYTLTDRGTWLSFNNKGPLIVVIEGDPVLLNRYDVILLEKEFQLPAQPLGAAPPVRVHHRVFQHNRW